MSRCGFLKLNKIFFQTKNMKKAKSSETTYQKTTRNSSKIIETNQGIIIDFSKFKAEPKKSLKNKVKGEENLTKLKKNYCKAAEDQESRSKKLNVNSPKAEKKSMLQKNTQDNKFSNSEKHNTETNETISKAKNKSKQCLKTASKTESIPKKSPVKRQHIKIEVGKNVEEPSASKSIKVQPTNWEEVLNNLREMRKNWDAPVDTMGCHKCQDNEASPQDQRYQNLLALMLSSQTKDQVTHAAMQRLIDSGCSVDKINVISEDELGKLIYPVSFWKNKVKYIKKTTDILKSQYDGDIPHTVKEMVKLPGVGPKMAHICMQVAWNECTGIGVDTHVHRISNRLGWVKTKTPEQTRMALEGLLPKEVWPEVNVLLVGFGQTICTSEKPKCNSCMNKPICPSSSDF